IKLSIKVKFDLLILLLTRTRSSHTLRHLFSFQGTHLHFVTDVLKASVLIYIIKSTLSCQHLFFIEMFHQASRRIDKK
ncbi:hypothetical protein DQX05_07835, partial [Paenibacillus thiaminolyticus]